MFKEYNIYTAKSYIVPVSTIRANSADAAINAYAMLTNSNVQDLRAKIA